MDQSHYQPQNFNEWIDQLYEICKKHIKDEEDRKKMEKLIAQLKDGNLKLCRLAKAIVVRVCLDPPPSECDSHRLEPDPQTPGDCDDTHPEPDPYGAPIRSTPGDCDDTHPEPDISGPRR